MTLVLDNTSKRITIYNHLAPLDGKIFLLSNDCTFQSFLLQASNKLNMKATRVFLINGGEVDDLSHLREDDCVYLTSGEAFRKSTNYKNSDSDVSKKKTFQIAVIGPGAVGKSALTFQFVSGVFIVDYDPTIEDAYRKIFTLDGQNICLNILDTAGQEDYFALRQWWYRDKDGFVLVFSVDDPNSLSSLHSFFNELTTIHETGLPPIVLVGNKCDLQNREVTSDQAQAFINKYSKHGFIQYIECSAKTSLNVTEAFYILTRQILKNKNISSHNSETKCSCNCFPQSCQCTLI